MSNVLVISIESQRVRTEEIYFVNTKNFHSSSFKKDKTFLKKLNLKDVFFLSFNISTNFNKITQKMERMESVEPYIHEAFILCDRDNNSYSDIKIKQKYLELSRILRKTLKMDKKNIHHLKYKLEGQKFEDFLACHFSSKKSYQNFKTNYKKTDKNLYLKTMGISGKNINTLRKNLPRIDSKKNFQKLFAKRLKVSYDKS